MAVNKIILTTQPFINCAISSNGPLRVEKGGIMAEYTYFTMYFILSLSCQNYFNKNLCALNRYIVSFVSSIISQLIAS
jgi:hypothetical protein